MTTITPFKINWVQEVRDYSFITFGLLLYAVGVTFFMLPYQITTGGVTGIAIIVEFATNRLFEVQDTYFVINMGLLIAAIKVLGWKFCVRTIYSVGVLTFLLWLLRRMAENENGQLPTLVGDQVFMACVIGASLEGIALAICFTHNGSTGGTDIISAMVNKYREVTFGTMNMIMDFFIITSCFFVFHDWTKVVFGFATLFIASTVLDYVFNRSRQSVLFFIVSEHYDEIANIINQTGRGVTVLDGKGWYTKTSRPVLMVLAKKRESLSMFRIIKRYDNNAFVSMSNVTGVYGEGFDKMKVKVKEPDMMGFMKENQLKGINPTTKPTSTNP